MKHALPDAAATPRDVAPSSVGSAELDVMLAARAITPLFQAIVHLPSGEPVAYEAVPHGPEGGPLHRPDLMFAAARRAGRVEELDRLFRARGLAAVVESGLRAPLALFVNREPSGATADASAAAQLLMLRRRGLRAVIVLTERDLSRDPSELLAFADSIRAAGMGIGLDVGVDADSLALMPFLMPDVIKLHIGVLRRRPDEATGQLLSAIRAHAERRAAVILAEGIEIPEHERLAVALGATLGQGPLLGRPGPLPTADVVATLPAPTHPLVLRDPERELALASPFDMVTRDQVALRSPGDLLMALRDQLEQGVGALRGLVVVLLSCIDGSHVSYECATGPCTCAGRYAALAASARFVAALGEGAPAVTVPGVRGSQLAPGDPVGSEWNMVVVSPHFAAAIVAKERFDAQPEEGRVFDYALTYDHALVIDVARTLMMRAVPRDELAPVIEAVLAADGSGGASSGAATSGAAGDGLLSVPDHVTALALSSIEPGGS